MWRFYILKTLLVFFFLMGITKGQLMGKERLNVVWLMAEDIGPDLECYGMQGVSTPHLDELAKTGLMYTQCYCANPICSPNRSAMMVGVHPSVINAHHHRSNRDVPLAPPYVPFTKMLRDAGYTTILGSSLVMDRGRKTDCNFLHQPVGPWDGREHFGLFDKYDEILPEDQPFFAQIQLKVTHRGDWWDRIRSLSPDPVEPSEISLPPYLADHPVIRADWAKYLDQIEYMDSEVGQILKDLENKDLLANTVIIFIGDNGRCNIRAKGYLYDPGIHVPLIIAGLQSESAEVRNDLVSTTDLTATILDLCGVSLPDYMEAQSILDEAFHREYVYSTRDRWDEIFDKSASITTGRYHYIRNHYPEIAYDAGHAYLEFYRPALHVMRKMQLDGMLTEEQQDYFDAFKPEEELYDLVADPHELENLVRRSEFAPRLDSMRRILDRYQQECRADTVIHHPTDPLSRQVLNYLKYHDPKAYVRMTRGEEVGFQKYVQHYRNHLLNQHTQ